jgi:hypothetical protein
MANTLPSYYTFDDAINLIDSMYLPQGPIYAYLIVELEAL